MKGAAPQKKTSGRAQLPFVQAESGAPGIFFVIPYVLTEYACASQVQIGFLTRVAVKAFVVFYLEFKSRAFRVIV